MFLSLVSHVWLLFSLLLPLVTRWFLYIPFSYWSSQLLVCCIVSSYKFLLPQTKGRQHFQFKIQVTGQRQRNIEKKTKERKESKLRKEDKMESWKQILKEIFTEWKTGLCPSFQTWRFQNTGNFLSDGRIFVIHQQLESNLSLANEVTHGGPPHKDGGRSPERPPMWLESWVFEPAPPPKKEGKEIKLNHMTGDLINQTYVMRPQ